MPSQLQKNRRSPIRAFAQESYDTALNCSAKGFKPFKGKGELLQLLDDLETTRLRLRQQAADIANEYNSGFLSTMPIVLKQHGQKQEGTYTLRWRDRSQHQMGVKLWENTIAEVGPDVREALIDLEVQRCQFNGIVATVSKQLRSVRRVLADIEFAESFRR